MDDEDEEEILTPSIVPPALSNDGPKKKYVLQDMSEVLVEATTTEDIIHVLELGANCYSRSTGEQCPSKVIPVEVWRGIILHAANLGQEEVSLAALRFLKQALSIDRRFDLENIKRVEDVDLVEAMWRVFECGSEEARELALLIASYVAVRSEENRDHVLEFFDMEQVCEECGDLPVLQRAFLQLLKAVTMFPVGEESRVSLGHLAAGFIESVAFSEGPNGPNKQNKPDSHRGPSEEVKLSVYHALMVIIHLGLSGGMVEALLEHQELFEGIGVVFPSNLYLLNEAVLMFVIQLLKANEDVDIEDDIDPEAVVSLIRYVDPAGANWRHHAREAELAMRAAEALIASGAFSLLPPLKVMGPGGESQIAEILRIVERCKGQSRMAAVELLATVAEVDRQGAYIILHKRAVRKVAWLLDSDEPLELLCVLRLLQALAVYACRLGKLDVVLEELDYGAETVVELMESEYEEIATYAEEVCRLCRLCPEDDDNENDD